MKRSLALTLVILSIGAAAYYTWMVDTYGKPLDPMLNQDIPPMELNIMYLPGDICDVTIDEPLTQEILRTHINKCVEDQPLRINIARASI